MSEIPALTAQRRLELAYLAVFGNPNQRTTDQHLVWQSLESFCYAYRLEAEGMSNGEIAIRRTMLNQGRRSVWLMARGQLIKALSPPRTTSVSRKK